MNNSLYSNKYISTPNKLSLNWLKFVEERNNEVIKEYENSLLQKRSNPIRCIEQERDCNNLSQNIKGITDPLCLKELLGYKNANVYGYFTSSMLYPDIVDRSKLIIFDYELECGSNSIFYEDSDIYFTEQGNYKITYGAVCCTARGSLSLLLNNLPVSQECHLNKVGFTKFMTQLSLNNGDILSLMLKGGFIKLYNGGINGFILIEKCR